jgi:protein gp37
MTPTMVPVGWKNPFPRWLLTRTQAAMSARKIEWTEQTWNPVTGCTKVSPGCKHCYAERMALHLQATGAAGYAGGFALTLREDRLGQPLERDKPTVYFVCSMADLFHEDVPDPFIDRVLAVIRRTPRHTYLLLTKRAERLPDFFASRSVPANVWLGVTVEDRRHGLPRIEHLRQVSVRVRFLSVEPLLEDLGPFDLSSIGWVIVGGESGPDARPMRKEWALSVRDRCAAAGVNFFFKQWGAWGPDGVRRDKKANGRLLARRLWDERPELRGTLL